MSLVTKSKNNFVFSLSMRFRLRNVDLTVLWTKFTLSDHCILCSFFEGISLNVCFDKLYRKCKISVTYYKLSEHLSIGKVCRFKINFSNTCTS